MITTFSAFFRKPSGNFERNLDITQISDALLIRLFITLPFFRSRVITQWTAVVKRKQEKQKIISVRGGVSRTLAFGPQDSDTTNWPKPWAWNWVDGNDRRQSMIALARRSSSSLPIMWSLPETATMVGFAIVEKKNGQICLCTRLQPGFISAHLPSRRQLCLDAGN